MLVWMGKIPVNRNYAEFCFFFNFFFNLLHAHIFIACTYEFAFLSFDKFLLKFLLYKKMCIDVHISAKN
jgi:hypothetical protein